MVFGMSGHFIELFIFINVLTRENVGDVLNYISNEAYYYQKVSGEHYGIIVEKRNRGDKVLQKPG